MNRILLVEDEPILRAELARLLTRHGYEVHTAGDVAAALTLAPDTFDLILTDLRLPGASAHTLIDEVEDTPIIVMTAFGTVNSAVEAMKRGAADYLSKPLDPDELLLIIERVLSHARQKNERRVLRAQLENQWDIDGIVGTSAVMAAVFERIQKVAPTNATVLILGETGTGKELVARSIHANSSRSDEAFVPVNCAAIPDSLIESELFGHERGAFTGAVQAHTGLVQAAHGGTLFLDEIGELPPHAQSRLLRVLQESEIRRVGASQTRRVDVRLLAATHRDLARMVEDGTFRQDLYFRLKVLDITLPPLRDRDHDIQALADYMLRRALERVGRTDAPAFSPDALEAMHTYQWPGNVRELANAIERAVILYDSGEISRELLGIPYTSPPPVKPAPRVAAQTNTSLEDYFRDFVLANQDTLSEKELAELLGISRKTLWQRRKKLGLPRPK